MKLDPVALTVFIAFFGLVTVLGFFAARWRRGDLSQLDKLFDVDGAIEGNGWHVVLKAREPALAKAIGAISLSGDNYVRGIKIDEAGGDRTTISFSGLQSGEQAMQPEEAALF